MTIVWLCIIVIMLLGMGYRSLRDHAWTKKERDKRTKAAAWSRNHNKWEYL